MHKRGAVPEGPWRARGVRVLQCACLLFLLAFFLSIPAWAQNTAEATPASQQEQPQASPKPAPAQAEQPPPAASPETESPSPAGAAAAAGDGGSTPAGAPPAMGPDQAAPGVAPAENKEQPPVAGDVDSSTPDAVDQGAEPAASGDAPVNAGEAEAGGAMAQPKPEKPQEPASPVNAPDTLPNQAESRPAGTGTANRAEESGPDDGESNIAEPPGAPFELPTAAELAGSVADYTVPSIELSIPLLDEIPARPDPDSFYLPSRDYLERRPLPPVDETETDEERLARSIDETLQMIDLAQEQRPAEGVQIPLPSGVITFKASDAFQYDRPNRILKFTGNAEILFQDIAIWADYIEVNDSAATAYAKGYVAVQNMDEILYCDEAYVNYDTQTLELFWVEGNTGGPRLYGALYFEADRAWGTFDYMIMEKVKITTCDPFCGNGNKEYQILARKAVYKRDRSIVLNDVFIQIQGTKVGYTPVLAFPLMRDKQYIQDESEIQQNYGYNRSEGWFAKFAYTYSVRYAERLTKPLYGVAKVDLTEKKGPGLGIRQDFYIPALGVTTIRGYYQREWDWETGTRADNTKVSPEVNFSAELYQDLNLSRRITGSLTMERTDEYIPSITQQSSDRRNNRWNSRLNLAYKSDKTDITLGATHSETTTGGTQSTGGTQQPERVDTSQVGDFQLTQRFSKETQFTLSENYSARKGGTSGQGLPADQEGNFEMRLNWRGGTNTSLNGWSVRAGYAERGLDFDRDRYTRDSNATIRKELPSVEISAPNDLINDGAYVNQFKLNFDNLVTGRLRDPDSSFRFLATVGGGDRVEFSRSSSLDTRFTFRQYAYDDGNAQYILNPITSYVYDPHSWWRFSTGWSMTYRQGVKEPPVSGDRQTYYQSVNYDLSMTNHRSWSWQLRSGYNLASGQPSSITSTFNWDPNRTFGLTHTISYDPRTERWGTTRVNGSWRSTYIDPDGYYNWMFSFALDTNIEDSFRTSKLNTTWYKRFKRGWSTEIVGGYRDGQDEPIDLSWEFLKDYLKTVKVRKVNCCTTIEGTWRLQYNEVMINVYLNALPQYPGTFWTRRPFDNDYEQQFLYPIDQTRNDILTDVFGINQRLGYGGF